MDEKHIPYETLGRYLANKIDKEERESVDRHLKDCAFCRQDLADAQSWQPPKPERPWWRFW